MTIAQSSFVLFEHPDFIILNKPCGVSMHRSKENSVPTIIELLEESIPSHPAWFLVHRLDNVTSGVMVVAKNSNTAAILSNQFASRTTQKLYLAVSHCKKLKKKQGLVMGDMKKSRNGSYKLTRDTTAPAITQFQSFAIANEKVVIDEISALPLRGFLLKPSTGKTHQLRVMMQSIGAPILGDNRYKGTNADRTYLHAYSLSFSLHNKDYQFSALPTETTGLYWGNISQHIQENSGMLTNWPTLPHGRMKDKRDD